MNRWLLFAVLLGGFLPASAGAATPPLEPFDQTADLYVLDSGCHCILEITPAGQVSVFVTDAELTSVGAGGLSDKKIAFAADGTMYFTAGGDLFRRTPDGTLTLFVSEAAFDAAASTSTDVDGVAFGSDGMLYLCDDRDPFVYRVDPSTGGVSVVVGPSDFDALSGISDVDLEEGIVGAEGGIVYVAADNGSDTNDDVIFAIDITTDTVSVLPDDPSFSDLDVDMTRHPNGDLIVGDDTGASNVLRVTPAGAVSVFIPKATIDAVASTSSSDLEGGLEFDAAGNLYIGENATDSILRFDSTGGSGTVFVDAATIQAVTGTAPDLNAGMAFSPVDISRSVSPAPPLGGSGLLLAVVALLLVGSRKVNRLSW